MARRRALPGGYDTSYCGDPAAPNGDAFLVRLAADLATQDFGTFLGAQGTEQVCALALDAPDRGLLVGRTESFHFPTTPGAFQTTHTAGAIGEGFVLRLALLRHPVPLGAPKLNSCGAEARIGWAGFPGFTDQDLVLRLSGGMPGQKAILFQGLAAASTPFFGGTLNVLPPVARDAHVTCDFVGFAQADVPVEAALIDQTLRYPWFVDPGDPLGVGLSDGLEVPFHPGWRPTRRAVRRRRGAPSAVGLRRGRVRLLTQGDAAGPEALAGIPAAAVRQEWLRRPRPLRPSPRASANSMSAPANRSRSSPKHVARSVPFLRRRRHVPGSCSRAVRPSRAARGAAA